MAKNVIQNLRFGDNRRTAVNPPFLDGFCSFLAVFSVDIFLRVFSTNLTWIFWFWGFSMLTPNSNISSIKRKIPPTSRHDLGRRESLGTATIARNERFRMSRYQKCSISWSNSHWASRTSPLKILRLSPKWRFWNTFLLQKCHDLIRNSELRLQNFRLKQ